MHTTRTAIAAAASYIYFDGLRSILRDGPSMFGESYGSHFQFLTILGVTVSLIQAVVALIGELSQLYILQLIADYLLQLSAPLEVLISILYWGIRTIDIDLVIDPRVGVRLARALDRELHLWPAVLQSLAALVPLRPWRAGFVAPAAGFSLVGAGYWWWVNETFKHNGFYPYPLLAVVSYEQRLMVFATATLLTLIVFKGLQSFQRFARSGMTL